MAWHDELDNDTRAAIAAKGWDRLGGDAAAQAIYKSYTNLERMRPDPNKTLTIPDQVDQAGWADLWRKLGAPEKPEGYTFDGVTVKGENGQPAAPDADLLGFVRGLAAELHLPVAAANRMAERLIAFGEETDSAMTNDRTQRINDTTTRLKGEWGADYDNKTAIAANAFDALKWPKETVDALIDTLGVDGAMKLGHDLGSRMGEGQILGGGGAVADTTVKMTREQALVERNRLMDDADFGAKVASGDRESLKKIHDLSVAILGGDAQTGAGYTKAPENFGRTREDPYGEQRFGQAPQNQGF